MAQECTESSVAISSSTPPNWWDLHHASSLSSWTNTSPWHQSNPSSNSSCEEDVTMSTSFTNASNHSGLTVESSRQHVEPACSNELMGEQASDTQLWSHILLNVGSNSGELHNSSTQDVGENLLDALSTKRSMSSGIFEPVCDFFTSSTSFNNNFEKQLNGFSESLIESGRLSKLSIAPPDSEFSRQFDIPLTCCNISLSNNSPANHCSQPQTYSDGMGPVHRNNSGFLSCYGHEHRHTEPPGPLFRRSFINNYGVGYHVGLNSSSVLVDNTKYCCTAPEATSTSARNFANGISFRSRLSRALIDSGKQSGLQTASVPTGKEKGTTIVGKMKRSEETLETVLKKPKQESSTVTPEKTQAPKVKLSERITALQQIVSPFGRTDTASVLYEAIQYITFLQEQVQLLSNPYMKTNSHKDPWGGLERKDKGDAKLDLRSRGLCLVPVSCTSQVYHENTGSDYWTPTYRGCLYR